MLDKILEQAKSQLVPALIDDPQVDNAQADQIAQVSGETVINSLSDQLKSGDTSGIMEMLSGADTDPSNPAVNNLSPKVAENLISRLGISPELAQNIASKAIPIIMNMFNGKVADAKNQGVDIGSIIGGLVSGQGGGFLGKLGGLFGGKKDTSADSKGGLSDILGSFLGK